MRASGRRRAAYLVPLEYAPLFTTLMSMMLMIGVAAVIVSSEAPLLRSWPRRILALTLFLVAPSSAEIWLNTLGASYYSLVAAVVLLLGAGSTVGADRRANLVLFAIFCFLSPLCFVLLPAVAWLCWRAPAAHRGHAVILLGMVALQVLAHLASQHPVTGARTAPPDVATLGHLLASNYAVLPFLGWPTAEAYAAVVLGLDPPGFRILGVAAAVAFATVLLALVARGRRDETTGVLLLVWLAAVAAMVGLGLDDKRLLIPPGHGERYTWLPNCLLLLLVMHQIDRAGLRKLRLRPLLASGLLAMALFHATTLFARFTLASPEWPVWEDEVTRWREDPERRPLASWPAQVPGTWEVPLRPR